MSDQENIASLSPRSPASLQAGVMYKLRTSEKETGAAQALNLVTSTASPCPAVNMTGNTMEDVKKSSGSPTVDITRPVSWHKNYINTRETARKLWRP